MDMKLWRVMIAMIAMAVHIRKGDGTWKKKKFIGYTVSISWYIINKLMFTDENNKPKWILSHVLKNCYLLLDNKSV